MPPVLTPASAYDELLEQVRSAQVGARQIIESSNHEELASVRSLVMLALDEMIPWALERHEQGLLGAPEIMAAVTEVVWIERHLRRSGHRKSLGKVSPSSSFRDGVRIYAAMPHSTQVGLMRQLGADYLLGCTLEDMPPLAAFEDTKYLINSSGSGQQLHNMVGLTGHPAMAVEITRALQRLHLNIDGHGADASQWLRDAPLGDLAHLLREAPVCGNEGPAGAAVGTIGRLQQLHRPLLDRFAQLMADRANNTVASSDEPMLTLPISPCGWVAMARDVRDYGGDVSYVQYGGPAVDVAVTGDERKLAPLEAALHFSISSDHPDEPNLVVELVPVDVAGSAEGGLTPQEAIRMVRHDARESVLSPQRPKPGVPSRAGRGVLRYTPFDQTGRQSPGFLILRRGDDGRTDRPVEADRLFSVGAKQREACRTDRHRSAKALRSVSASPGPPGVTMGRSRNCAHCGQLQVDWTWAHELDESDPFRIDENSGSSLEAYISRLAAQAVSEGQMAFTRARALTIEDVRAQTERARRASQHTGQPDPRGPAHRRLRA